LQAEQDYKIVEISSLCKTLGGLEVPLLKITNFSKEDHMLSQSSKYL